MSHFKRSGFFIFRPDLPEFRNPVNSSIAMESRYVSALFVRLRSMQAAIAPSEGGGLKRSLSTRIMDY